MRPNSNVHIAQWGNQGRRKCSKVRGARALFSSFLSMQRHRANVKISPKLKRKLSLCPPPPVPASLGITESVCVYVVGQGRALTGLGLMCVFGVNIGNNRHCAVFTVPSIQSGPVPPASQSTGLQELTHRPVHPVSLTLSRRSSATSTR